MTNVFASRFSEIVPQNRAVLEGLRFFANGSHRHVEGWFSGETIPVSKTIRRVCESLRIDRNEMENLQGLANIARSERIREKKLVRQ